MRKIVWLVVSCLMVLSLVIASCAPREEAKEKEVGKATVVTAVEEEEGVEEEEVVAPGPEVPKYGGTLNLAVPGPANWDWDQSTSWQEMYTPLWGSNWAKGPADGYGAYETDFTNNYDIYDHYEGWAAEKTSWTIDPTTNEATIVFQIRRGLRYHVIPDNEASRLVNGREMTADDVVYALKWQFEPRKARYGDASLPRLRTAEFSKTGPWEVTVKLKSAEDLLSALSNLTGKRWIIRPPEIEQRYGTYNRWELQIGTGPFMLKDFVRGSVGVQIRNPNYWAKDPVGPGKGNQLPYIDTIKKFEIPDLSTQFAALRTGKIDMLFGLNLERAEEIRLTAPKLKELEFYNWTSAPSAVYMRVDIPPTSDIRVRQALMMATDFETIRQTLNQGQGEIITFPHMPSVAYGGALGAPKKGLYIGLDDPDLPAEVKELYSYNPEKAKQLLEEAGYPDGFKVEVLTTAGEVDYLSIYKDQWSKVGVQLEMMIREFGPIISLVTSKQTPPLVSGATGSVGRFHTPEILSGVGMWNRAQIADPTIEAALSKIRVTALTDFDAALTIMRDLTRDYILPQAYAIPTPMAPFIVFWWPWLKGYSGETTMQLAIYYQWAIWVWLDQDLKKSMGY